MSDDELPPSRLGTKDHWDEVYKREVNVFRETGDEGEVWFGDASVKKMTDWAVKNIPASRNPRILECGCGNGTLLLSFRHPGKGKQPYRSSCLTGIDYSEASIELAKGVERARKDHGPLSDTGDSDDDSDEDQQEEGREATPTLSDEGAVDWRVADLLRHDFAGETWDLVLDKGTYDALALSDDPLEEEGGRLPSAVYPEKVAKLVGKGGFFLITSCNFTEAEVKTRFGRPELGLTYHSRVAHPSFSFGGKSGTTVCTVAFQKD